MGGFVGAEEDEGFEGAEEDEVEEEWNNQTISHSTVFSYSHPRPQHSPNTNMTNQFKRSTTHLFLWNHFPKIIQRNFYTNRSPVVIEDLHLRTSRHGGTQQG